MATDSAPSVVRPKPSRLRGSVRWCRRSVYLVLLVLGSAGVYLNQIGLPDFLKQPLLDQLKARGLSLDFARLRVRLGRGLIAEKVKLDRLGEQAGEHFFADEIQIKLKWSPLLQARAPEVQALKLKEGLIQIPVPAEGTSAPFLFQITGVSGVLAFLGPEEWELRSLEATSLRSHFRAFGSVTNASALRSLRPAPQKLASQAWKRQLRRLGNLMDAAEFDETPLLSIAFHADLRQPARSVVEIELRAKGGRHLDLAFQDLLASVQLNEPPGTNGLLPMAVRLEASRVNSHSVGFTEFTLDASGDLSQTNALPDLIEWSLRAKDLQSPWASASKLVLSGLTSVTNAGLQSALVLTAQQVASQITNASAIVGALQARVQAQHSHSNWLSGTAQISGTDLTSPWASAAQLSLQLDARQLNHSPAVTPLDSFWHHLESLAGQLTLRTSNLVARLPKSGMEVAATVASSSLAWSPGGGGRLTLSNLFVATPAGTAVIQGDLNPSTRRANASFDAHLDLQAYRPLLTPAAQRWIAQYGWPSNQPPHLTGEAGVTLPAWTNRQPDWRAEVVPTLSLTGSVSGGRFTFRDIPGDSAQGLFSYSNHVWRIPELTARRPEGSVRFSYEGHDVTKDYHFHVLSSLNPLIVRPLFDDPKVARAFDEVSLSTPPILSGDVWGVWKDRQRSRFDVQIAATNLVFRGETIESVTGRLQFTNALLTFTDVSLKSLGSAEIPGGAYDIATRQLSFTNTRTRLDPLRVARLIGPKSASIMSNYLFGVPPAVTLEGVVGIGTNQTATNIRFKASAPQFHWWRLDLTHAAADLHFLGQTLALTGLTTDLHGGSAAADLYFDWSAPGPGSLVRGQVHATNLVLTGLMHAVVSPSNRLEGVLQGSAAFSGSSRDTNSWSGSGVVTLRDGYLWDVPMFGIFSKLFDAVSPGLGQTRFKEGQMTFTATNSVLSSRDLSVRSAAMRLSYRGTVDMASRLDAQMEAVLFRDTPLIGPLISFVLTPFTKLFVYDVKGTLKKPVAEPRYVPKLLLAPLRPFKTLKELLPKEDPPDEPPAPPAR